MYQIDWQPRDRSPVQRCLPLRHDVRLAVVTLPHHWSVAIDQHLHRAIVVHGKAYLRQMEQPPFCQAENERPPLRRSALGSKRIEQITGTVEALAAFRFCCHHHPGQRTDGVGVLDLRADPIGGKSTGFVSGIRRALTW